MTESVAVMSLGEVFALLAFDLAAPKKLTVTVVYLLLNEGLVAPPTAHELAAIQTRAVLPTVAAASTKRALLGLVLAEVWGLVQVDQIFFGGTFV